MKPLRFLAIPLSAIVAFSHASAEHDPEHTAKPAISAKAHTTIINNAGEEVGSAQLVQGPRGIVVSISVRNLPPGKHGMHFHAVGTCTPPESFSEAAGHIMPKNLPHGFLHPEGPHAGNLPNLVIASDGSAEVELYTNLLMLDRGPGRVLDADGSTLIIHANEDDHFTQPIGGSGARIACGVIKQVTDD
ncbi:MAG: superoxide dismutase family protein [Pseudomonadota bacterium]